MDWIGNRKHLMVSAGCALALAIGCVAPLDDELSEKVLTPAGSAASIRSAPFTVSLQRVDASGQFQSVCSGVIFDEATVLTASHCIRGGFGPRPEQDRWRVVAGVSDAVRDASSSSIHRIAAIAVRPEVFETTCHAAGSQLPLAVHAPNDLAVLKVVPHFDLSSGRTEAISVAAQVPDIGTRVRVAGFGRNIEEPARGRRNSGADGRGVVTGRFGTAPMHIMGRRPKPAGHTGQWGQDLDGIVYTAGSEEVTGELLGACNGDSGGPLFTGGSNPELLGILHAGSHRVCGRASRTASVRIRDHLNWVNAVKAQLQGVTGYLQRSPCFDPNVVPESYRVSLQSDFRLVANSTYEVTLDNLPYGHGELTNLSLVIVGLPLSTTANWISRLRVELVQGQRRSRIPGHWLTESEVVERPDRPRTATRYTFAGSVSGHQLMGSKFVIHNDDSAALIGYRIEVAAEFAPQTSDSP